MQGKRNATKTNQRSTRKAQADEQDATNADEPMRESNA